MEQRREHPGGQSSPKNPKGNAILLISVEFRKDTLKNGIRLITVPMPNLQSVTAMIGVGVGSRNEEARVQGLAHFTEHMMFKGTARRPTALQIATELDSLGARSNASTSKEVTDYYAQAAGKNFPKIMDILGDILLNSKFDPKEIDKERGVILEELKMYRDDPKDWVSILSDRLTYGEHPLGWDIVGTESSLGAISREDFLEYRDHWYRSENIVVAVAGKIVEKEVISQVRELLSKLPKESISKPLPFQAQQTHPEILVEERKVDQTNFILSARAYPRGHRNFEKVRILTIILGVGMSSRLFTEVREKRGLAYRISAGRGEYSDAGEIAVTGGVNNKRFEEALKVVIQELGKLKDDLVSAGELQKAKEILRGNIVLRLETTPGTCDWFLEQELLERKIETPEEKLKKIDAVTAEDVRDVARELFVSEGLNLALIGPFPNPEKFRPLLKI